MRILLTGFGTRGDVQPLVALGIALRAAGHEVTIGAAEGFEEWVRGHGLEFKVIGVDLKPFIEHEGPQLARHPFPTLKRLLERMRDEMMISFQQTYDAAHEVDLIVSGVHPTAPTVAEALDVPHRTLLFCPQLVPSRHHPPMGVPWLGLPPLCNELLWRTFERGFDHMLGGVIRRERRWLRLPEMGRLIPHLLGDRPIVASDPELGALPPDAPDSIVQTGSISLTGDARLDPALEQFLASGEPPVYVGFGSMPDADPLRTTRLIVEALEQCERRGVIFSGWAGLGIGAVPRTVFVAGSSSHEALLPRVAVAVHHGGAGTTAAAVRAGVPQIVVPHLADQFYWGREVHRRGLGSRPIPRARLSVSRLARALDVVLANPYMVKRAHATRIALGRRDGIDAVVRLLESSTPARRRAG